jgi:hypothetical protein
LPNDSAKQSAVQSYVNQITGQFPEIAAPWAESLSDTARRNSAIQNVARQWLQTDPVNAQTWLLNTSLPDDQKQMLLKNGKQ